MRKPGEADSLRHSARVRESVNCERSVCVRRAPVAHSRPPHRARAGEAGRKISPSPSRIFVHHSRQSNSGANCPCQFLKTGLLRVVRRAERLCASPTKVYPNRAAAGATCSCASPAAPRSASPAHWGPVTAEVGKASTLRLRRQVGSTGDNGAVALPAADERADSSLFRRFSSFLAFLAISLRRFSN